MLNIHVHLRMYKGFLFKEKKKKKKQKKTKNGQTIIHLPIFQTIDLAG